MAPEKICFAQQYMLKALFFFFFFVAKSGFTFVCFHFGLNKSQFAKVKQILFLAFKTKDFITELQMCSCTHIVSQQ